MDYGRARDEKMREAVESVGGMLFTDTIRQETADVHGQKMRAKIGHFGSFMRFGYFPAWGRNIVKIAKHLGLALVPCQRGGDYGHAGCPHSISIAALATGYF